MTFTSAHRLVTAAGLLLMVCGVLAVVAGCVPFSVIQPLGVVIRKADDVTPERYHRYVAACWFLGLWSFTLGVVAFRNRAPFGEWLAIVGGAVPTWMAVPRKPRIEWGGEVWLIFTLGVMLRLLRLNDSMAYDEAYTFLNFASRPWYEAIADYNSTNNHLFNTFCMHWTYRLFGDAEWALRLPVLVAGIAALALTYPWAYRWCGRRVALVAMTLVAISPLMITYSVDARGYMFVAAAALAFDGAAASIDGNPQQRRGAWIVMVIAGTIGLWSMPIMLYAILGTSLWFLAGPWLGGTGVEGETPESRRAQFFFRVRGIACVAGAVGLLVGLFYLPAFVFRGLRFLKDPIMQAEAPGDFLRTFASSLHGVWQWWTEGFLPDWAWGVFLAAGLVFWLLDRQNWLRLLAPFAVVLVLNLLQRVAPPPRIYLFLFPWVAILASRGIMGIVEFVLNPAGTLRGSGGVPAVTSHFAALALSIGGSWYFQEHPVLIHASERRSFYRFDRLMDELLNLVARDDALKHRLIVPLPCDLPAEFYRKRYSVAHSEEPPPSVGQGRSLEINGRPEQGEVIWLVTRNDEDPDTVLRSPLIALGDMADAGTLSWSEPVYAGPTLAIRCSRSLAGAPK